MNIDMNDEFKNICVRAGNNAIRDVVLNIALSKVNQGCCCQYVSDGIKEWYGVEISSEELSETLIHKTGLLTILDRQRNAWDHILSDETDNLTNIDRFYLQRKYGFDLHYMDVMFQSYEDGLRRGQWIAIVREALINGDMTPEQSAQQLAEHTSMTEDDAKEKVKSILEENQNEKTN